MAWETGSMDRETFLREYDLQLDKEFEVGDKAAQWAPGISGPRFWGSEDATIYLKTDDPEKGNGAEAAAAMTPDARFLAVSTNAVIRTYNLDTKGVHAELIGHLQNVQSLYFAPKIPEREEAAPTSSFMGGRLETYRLISEGAEVGGSGGEDGQIICWSLDAEGRQLGRAMPFAVESMADRTLAAISTDLNEHHGLSQDDVGYLRDAFVETLKKADTKNRIKHLPVWEGTLPGFGSQPISHDGQSLLFVVDGTTTQNDMRPPEELPKVVVSGVATHSERCRLRGHTEAIMWASWSPDDKTIATASWDKYYKIWDARTGECRHTIGPTDGQNWAGAFSPNGGYVLLSGGHPTKVAIYSVETGEEIRKLEHDHSKPDDWVRCISWSPAGNAIALVDGKCVVLWEPFEHKAETILRLTTDGTMLKRFNSFSIIKWVEGGRKLIVQDAEDTVFVWDQVKHWKWRLQRPRGTPLDVFGDLGCVQYLAESQTVVSLDGDRKVRFWRL